jgi:putative tricarboxylic transport membrane protein
VKRVEALLPASLVLYGAYVMWNSLTRMTYYNYARGAPGPGFLPFWLSVGLVVLGSILAFRALRPANVAPASAWPDAPARRRILLVFSSLVVTLLVFERLGFVVTMAAFMIVVGFGLGLRSWIVLLPTSLLVAVGLYALFSWLGVVLPAGIVKL